MLLHAICKCTMPIGIELCYIYEILMLLTYFSTISLQFHHYYSSYFKFLLLNSVRLNWMQVVASLICYLSGKWMPHIWCAVFRFVAMRLLSIASNRMRRFCALKVVLIILSQHASESFSTVVLSIDVRVLLSLLLNGRLLMVLQLERL